MNGNSVFITSPVYIYGSTFVHGANNPFLYHLHRHDSFGELLLIEQGEGEFEINGVPHHAEAGTLLVYEQGIWHKEKSTSYPFQVTFIAFKGLTIKGALPDRLLPEGRTPAIKLGENFPAIKAAMYEVLKAASSGEPESLTIAGHLLGILFAKLASIIYYGDAREPAVKPASEAVLLARRYIEEHYRRPITLEQLASLTYINKYHLAHLFKNQIGQSPIQFLIKYRMEVACYYLRMTDHAAGQIAAWVGYDSEPTFYHTFRKVIGMTPKAYRELAQRGDSR